ncbi:MAG: hypothetical protein CMH98_13905 [Oceanospirillaceae bacterium]|nr:hypothetical protein [Oceanospirillaceae bacterium]
MTTGNDLIEQSKAEFGILLHKEPEKLEALLKRALTEFQARAGVLQSVELLPEQADDNGYYDLPEFYAGLVVCEGSTGSIVDAKVVSVPDDNGGTVGKIKIAGAPAWGPYTFRYHMNLRNVPLDRELPVECVPIVGSLLSKMIDLPNTQRLRQVRQSEGLDTNDLESDQELKQRITDALNDIALRAQVLPMVMIG